MPFHTVHGVLKARILMWIAIPFSSGPHSVRPLHHDPSVLGGLTQHGCFIKLDKTVVLWSDWLVFCDYGFSLSALWCHLSGPTVLFVFPLPWTWGISSRHSSKAQLLLLTLDVGYLLMTTAPDLGHGISPLGCHSCPWMCDISTPPLLCHAAANLFFSSVMLSLSKLTCSSQFSSFKNLLLAFDHSNHTLEAVTKQLSHLYRQRTSEAFLFNIRNITF